MKKSLSWIGIICLVSAITLGLIYQVRLARVRGRLRQQVAALRMNQMPASLTEFSSRSSPEPKENAITWLTSRAQVIQDIDRQLWDIEFDPPLTDSDAKLVADTLASGRAAMEGIVEAAECQFYGVQFKPASVDEFERSQAARMKVFHAAARVLSHQSRLDLYEGNIDEATKKAIFITKLVQHLDEEPGFTPLHTKRGILGYAALPRIHAAIASGKLSHEQHLHVEYALAQIRPQEDFQRAIEGEICEAVDASEQWPISLFPNIRMAWCDRIDMLTVAHQSALMSFRIFERRADQHRQPESPLADIDVVVLVSRSSAGQTALVNTLRIHNMMQMQRARQIEELQVENALWHDPFAEQPLKVVELDGMRTIYSVGRDLRDDGGDVTSDENVDLGWTVPIVE